MTDPRIAAALADIEHLCVELTRHNADAPVAPSSSTRGRPKSAVRIERELRLLYELRAWLGSQLAIARGRPVFADPGLDALERAGIIAAPQAPRKKNAQGRGRPKGSGDGERRIAQVDWVQKTFAAIGHPVSTQRAIRIATEIRDRLGANSSEDPARRYYETLQRRRRHI